MCFKKADKTHKIHHKFIIIRFFHNYIFLKYAFSKKNTKKFTQISLVSSWTSLPGNLPGLCLVHRRGLLQRQLDRRTRHHCLHCGGLDRRVGGEVGDGDRGWRWRVRSARPHWLSFAPVPHTGGCWVGGGRRGEGGWVGRQEWRLGVFVVWKEVSASGAPINVLDAVADIHSMCITASW